MFSKLTKPSGTWCDDLFVSQNCWKQWLGILLLVNEVCIGSRTVLETVGEMGWYTPEFLLCEMNLLVWMLTKAHLSLPAASFYLDNIPVPSAVCCEVLMRMQCHDGDRRSELKEQMQNDTKTRMTQTSGNSIRSVVSQMVLREGGKIGLQTPDGLTLPWQLGEKGGGGVSSTRKTIRKICWSLSLLSSLSIAFHCLGQVAWWIFLLSALGFFSLKSCCALFPDGFSCAPVLPLCQAHH